MLAPRCPSIVRGFRTLFWAFSKWTALPSFGTQVLKSHLHTYYGQAPNCGSVEVIGLCPPPRQGPFQQPKVTKQDFWSPATSGRGLSACR